MEYSDIKTNVYKTRNDAQQESNSIGKTVTGTPDKVNREPEE